MAEKCVQTIGESSISYIAEFQLENGSSNKDSVHHTIYNTDTPTVKINDLTSDLNINLVKTGTAILIESDKQIKNKKSLPTEEDINAEVVKGITNYEENDRIKERKRNCEKVDIYLETPVTDENIVSTQSTASVIAKPKRLSDDFFSVDGEEDDNHILLNNSVEDACKKVDICEQKREGVLVLRRSSCDNEGSNTDGTKRINLVHEYSLYIEDDETSSSKFLKKIEINEILQSSKDDNNFIIDDVANSLNPIHVNNLDNNNDDDAEEEEINYDENDVQSMDAIERRDYEHEQKLTGGVIVRNRSLLKHENRLNLGLINNNIKKENELGTDEDKLSLQQNALTTTPTSSRNTTIRTTKSTVKLNLSATLDRVAAANDKHESEIIILNNKTLDVNNKTCSKLNRGESSSSSGSRSASKMIIEDCFINSNSNDSLSSNEDKIRNRKSDILDTNDRKLQIIATCSTSSSSKEKPIFASASSSTSSSSSSPNCQFSAHYCPENPGAEEANVVEIIDNDDEDNGSSKNYNLLLRPSKFSNIDILLENSRCCNKPDQLNFDATSAIPSSSSSSSHSRRSSKTNNLVERSIEDHILDPTQMVITVENDHEFEEDNWADCEEGSDTEEICTCKHYTDEEDRFGCESEDELLPSRDVDLSGFTNIDTTLPDDILQDSTTDSTPRIYRKRKLTGILSMDTTPGGRKRLALQHSLSPRMLTSPSTPSLLGSSPIYSSPTISERRTPRALIPTKENPPPELCDWLTQFQKWSHAERILAVDRLIERCEPTQVRYMMQVIEPQFQRDFISLLPKELALQVLTYLEPSDLLRAAQTCRSWRFLCDDNLLWKEKCKQVNIVTEPSTDRPKRGRAGNMPPISSPWKAAYMRQHIIEMNWRSRPIRDPKILKGHDDHVITCLQFCGNRIVSGSDDNTLKVWSAVTGKCLRTLVGHTGGVWSSQMSGNVIISGSTDRTLKVWNAETGQCVHTLYGHTSTVRCMHLHENKVVSGSRDATLRVWDINSGICLHVLVGHLAAVRCVQYDGRLVVSGAYDYMVKVWNPERQECLHTLQGHTNRVYSLQFDGIHVVSGSLDTSIRVWDAETGSCKHTLMGHQSLTSGMELRQNILVSGNADSTVKVWDIITGQCLQTLSGSNKHQSAVTCLQFNSRFVITSSDDGTVKLWDVKTGEFIRNLVSLDSGGSGGVVWRIRANDTKLVCAVGSRNGTEETKLMVLDFDVEGACLKCS